MFSIILQTNNSEMNRVKKNLTNIITLEGNLKESTSIIDPVIIIASDMATLINCNYLSIQTFGRSYFVNNIKAVRTGLFELSCHVDVLNSFADEILLNTAIIQKQADKWNLYLNDGSLQIYQNPMVLTKAFPSGFTTQEFVLAVAGS